MSAQCFTTFVKTDFCTIDGFIKGEVVIICHMKKQVVKKDFTYNYTQKISNKYLRKMNSYDYRILDKAKPMYLPIAKILKIQLPKTEKTGKTHVVQS